MYLNKLSTYEKPDPRNRIFVTKKFHVESITLRKLLVIRIDKSVFFFDKSIWTKLLFYYPFYQGITPSLLGNNLIIIFCIRILGNHL